MQSNLLYNVDQRPPLGKSILLSFQHVFAMFGATILVPLVVGLPVSVALFCSGLGTLIYQVLTRFKVPVYLGSSFAYIAAMQYAMKAMGGSVDASQTGIILIGCIYLLVAFILHFTGTGWLDKLLPPIVIGPMIIVIGLGLSPTAVKQAGFIAGGDPIHMLVAVVTFLVTGFVSTKAKGVFKIIPFLIGICFGYLFSMVLDLVDYSGIIETFQKGIFHLPDFYLPFETRHFNRYNFYFGPEALAILPVAFVTLSEHIGDHTVLSKICGRNFLKDPGLSKTIAGDGLATAVSAFLGGPANTTYGENTGVVSLTGVASTSVISGAAIIAIILSFFAPVQAVIMSIPEPVLGGMSLLLYGAIASNGLRVLIDNQVDFSSQRNLIIASAMMVLGLGGAVYPISKLANLSGTALSAVVGILLNLILPKDAKAK
ncbi:uracil permease [Peptoniphilus sp. oral taxon 375 str. F0436]|nr:uracil permease [Peptoniphilus sp. oral taxon 375 str. F0436]